MPSFNSTAARITEPTVGASVWASGSQVWNGNMGTFTPNPRNMPPNTHTCDDLAMPAAASGRSRMSKVLASARKYRAKKLTSISAEPNRVNKKNLMEA